MQRDQLGDPQFQLPDLTLGSYHLFINLIFVLRNGAFFKLTNILCLGQASSQYQGGEYSNYGQDYEDNGEQDGDEDTDWMNRKSVIKFEDVDDENEDEEREVRG